MNNQEFEVKYREEFYNIHDFWTKLHPGGTNSIRPHKNKDITAKMQHTQHSKTAYHLLEQYRITETSSGPKNDDEYLENLINWNEPMVGQIHRLGEKYYKWVHLPVDKKMRIFRNPILELFTITPWYMILIWIPITVGYVVYGIQKYVYLTKETSPFIPILLGIIFGLMLWTVVEYSMHRWVYHMELSGKNMIMIYVHFLSHGVHHKIPFDSQRIIFPFLPASLISFVVFQILAFFTPKSLHMIVFTGFFIGYLLYDIFHVYLHYGAPKEGTYAYKMKRYHNQHHFGQHDRGYGVTSLFWDNIFGSTIVLKNLSMAIRW